MAPLGKAIEVATGASALSKYISDSSVQSRSAPSDMLAIFAPKYRLRRLLKLAKALEPMEVTVSPRTMSGTVTIFGLEPVIVALVS